MKALVNLLFVVVLIGLLYQFAVNYQEDINLDPISKIETEACAPVLQMPIPSSDTTQLSYTKLLNKITKDINLLLKKAAMDIKQKEHSIEQANTSTADTNCIKN